MAELAYTAMPVPRVLRTPIANSRTLRQLALWPFVVSSGDLDPADARLLIDGAGARGAPPTARAIGAASGWENLHVDAPVALINGDHDLIAPLSDLRAYRGRVDRVLIVKQTGHLPMVERPAAFLDAFDHAITV